MSNHVHNRGTGAHAPAVELLQLQVDSLTEAVASRQRIGWATGVISGCLGVSASQAWQVLVTLSQHSNTKVHRIAQLIESLRDADEPTAADVQLATRLRAALGDDWDRLVLLDDSRHRIGPDRMDQTHGRR